MIVLTIACIRNLEVGDGLGPSNSRLDERLWPSHCIRHRHRQLIDVDVGDVDLLLVHDAFACLAAVERRVTGLSLARARLDTRPIPSRVYSAQRLITSVSLRSSSSGQPRRPSLNS